MQVCHTVNNGTLTMTTNTGLDGSATFTANQSGNSAFAVSLDLTEISLGAGLDSTATGLTLDLSEFTDMTAGMTATDEFIVLDSGAERRKAAGEIGNSIFSNTANYITSASLPTVNNATITIDAGTNLSGTAGHLQLIRVVMKQLLLIWQLVVLELELTVLHLTVLR